MKTIGMIGGLGPESTVDYYKRIIEEYRKITDNGTYPKILINSVDMTAVLKMTADKNLSGLADLLRTASTRFIKPARTSALYPPTPRILSLMKFKSCPPFPSSALLKKPARPRKSTA